MEHKSKTGFVAFGIVIACVTVLALATIPTWKKRAARLQVKPVALAQPPAEAIRTRNRMNEVQEEFVNRLDQHIKNQTAIPPKTEPFPPSKRKAADPPKQIASSPRVKTGLSERAVLDDGSVITETMLLKRIKDHKFWAIALTDKRVEEIADTVCALPIDGHVGIDDHGRTEKGQGIRQLGELQQSIDPNLQRKEFTTLGETCFIVIIDPRKFPDGTTRIKALLWLIIQLNEAAKVFGKVG